MVSSLPAHAPLLSRGERRLRRRSVAGAAPEAPPVGARAVTLRTREARASLRFTEGRVQQSTVVLVEAVGVGSEAQEQGVQPGDQVLALSDPVRPAELWQLNSRASVHFVRDALRLRVSPQVTLVLAPLEDAAGAVAAAAAAAAQQQQHSVEQRSGAEGDADAVSPNERPLPSAAQRRIKKRSEYLDVVSQRNDAPFFAALLVGVLATPLLLLALAYSNGWLLQLGR